MSCDIRAVSPEGPLYRLGRVPDAWAWPDWAFADPDGTFGNRYDDPEGEYRVLYASSGRFGAFVETLARFREDEELQRELAAIAGGPDDDDDAIGPGQVPAEWLAVRMLGSAAVEASFAAAGHSRSLEHLRGALAETASALGVDELDAAAIRLRVPRAFTQAVSRYVFDCQAEDGSAQFAGIHYLSRLGDDIRNWAIFEPPGGIEPPIADSHSAPIEHDDPDLAAALEHLDLRLID
jgi:hypothetical protein